MIWSLIAAVAVLVAVILFCIVAAAFTMLVVSIYISTAMIIADLTLYCICIYV